jgi:large subunit ribosomal protein L11
VITVYSDKSFSFVTKTPPATFFIKKALGLKSGSKAPGKDRLARSSVRSWLKSLSQDEGSERQRSRSAVKIIEGSARSMGIQVVEG